MHRAKTNFVLPVLVLFLTFSGYAHSAETDFTSTFRDLSACTFASSGNNPYFPLIPGARWIYEGEEDGEKVRLVITVLDETRTIDGIESRIVKEKETHDGELVEISRNFFAVCKKDNSVFYFGENTDIYENGSVVSHEGSWLHGENGAQAGLIMPGIILLGSRFQQEVAPDVALDRAEVVKVDLTVSTSAGIFDGCFKSKENTPLEKHSTEYKWYCPKIGLTIDDTLKLVNYDIP